MAATVLVGGVQAAKTDELGLTPVYWYKNVSGQRSYGSEELTWEKSFSTFIDTDEGSLCAASAKGGIYGTGFTFGTGDWTIVGRFRSLDTDNVPILSLGTPTVGSACLALASGGPGVITLSGCGGNAAHADLLTITVPDASTAFHSYAIQRVGQKVSLWVDGVKKGEVTRANNPSLNTFQFAAPYGGVGNTKYVAGAADSSLAVADFRFYRLALSADDLMTLTYPPRDEIGERPYIWYPFNDSLVQSGVSMGSIELTGTQVPFVAGRCGMKRTAIQAGGDIPYAMGMPWGVAESPWTVLVLAKSENAEGAVIFGTGNGSANARFALVSGGSDKVVLAGFSGTGGVYAKLLTANVPDATTTFHLYAIQRVGQNVSLWVDGVMAGELSRPNNPATNYFSFFSALDQTCGLRTATSAVVDDFRMYRKALTGDQMTSILNATQDELGETPVHWLKLNGDLASSGKCEPRWAGGTSNVAFGSADATTPSYFVSSGDKPTGTNVAWRSRNWTVVVKARSTDTDNAVIASFGASRSTASSSMALTSCGPGKIALSGFSSSSAHADLITNNVPDASTVFHYYAIRRTDLSVTLLVDGVEAGTISRPSNPTFNAFGLGTIFDGVGSTRLVTANDVAIDDFRVYERSLSNLELMALTGVNDEDSQVVATASWTGAGGDGSATNALNWACTNLAGRAVANGVPGAFAVVTLSGSVNLQVPASAPVFYDRITFAGSLSADVDWSGLGASTVVGTVDLASHALTVLPSDWDVTFTDTVANGELRIDVPNGETFTDEWLALTGGVKLVKQGAGTLVAKREAQTYTGGTEVQSGTLKFGVNGANQPLGAAGSAIVVRETGTLDLNGFVNEYLNPVELAGGALANTGAAQTITANSIASLTLSTDAQVNTRGSISIAASGMGPSSLDLGGHTLTVNVADNQVFRLMNCTATNGTVCVVGNNTKACFSVNQTSCRAATVDFDLTCTYAPYVPTTVHDMILRSDSVYQDVTPGVTSVAGTFTTFTTKFQNFQMLDGSTLDLSNWTNTFNTVSGLQDRSVTFAPEAHITVDVHGRELLPGQQLIAWTERPQSAYFRLDAASAAQHGVVAQSKGLFVATGMLIIVR